MRTAGSDAPAVLWNLSSDVPVPYRRSFASFIFCERIKDELFSTPAYLTIQPTVKRSVLIKRKCPWQQNPNVFNETVRVGRTGLTGNQHYSRYLELHGRLLIHEITHRSLFIDL